jgi:hypothetical protein
MEPADERPDDYEGAGGRLAAIPPQWGRPMDGRMTKLRAPKVARPRAGRNGAGRRAAGTRGLETVQGRTQRPAEWFV